MPTIAQAIAEGASRLKTSGVGQERRTAGALLGHVLGIDRAQIITRPEARIGESDYQAYLSLIERRAAGEPLQYITGHQEFYGLYFLVSRDVLIPRPETEFLVERVIELARTREDEKLIVDLGTGSGCIAVALAANLPRARLIATDISTAALDVARVNAERHGVADRIRFEKGDALEPLARLKLEDAIDVLATNPPYVQEGRPELVQREVREWEPPAALFAGVDGLDFYRRLLADGAKYVKPGGHLVCEIGYSQFEAITGLICEPWELVDQTRDLQGIPRTLCLRRVG